MTMPDLGALTRPQLKQLIHDATEELQVREHEERIALEEKLRSLVQDAGFDPAELQFGASRKVKRGKSNKNSNGVSNEG
jgi:hypothetical protein